MEIRADQPMRTCVGCRRRAARSELLRVVLVAGEVLPDPRGTAHGRGAHLHPTAECLALAERRRAFARALKHPGGQALRLDELREHLAQSAPSHIAANQEMEQ